MGKLSQYLGKPLMYFHPYEYGGWHPEDERMDGYTKKTCLYGRFVVPERKPVAVTRDNYIHYMSPGRERTALRSATPLGFAYAFYAANP